MGIITGTVTGQSIESNRGSANVRMLQVQLLGDNPETVEFFNISGEDTAPVNGDKVIVFDLGAGFKIAMVTKDLIVAISAAGEKEIYSYDESGKFARLKMKLDGSVGIKNEVESLDFGTVMTAFSDAIKAIVTTGGPTSQTVNAASQTAIQNALLNILKVITGI